MKPARISRELGGAPVGDARRQRRLVRTGAHMAAHPGASVCAATGGWSESMGAYRLLSSAHVTPQRILTPHRACLVDRAAACACVLLIQDTTELDFTPMRCMEGSGPLNDESRRGLFMHSHYAVSAEGLPLGLWDVALMARKDEHFRRRSGARKKRPLSEKESARWLEGWEHAQSLAAALPGREVFAVSDREGDIYEIYAAWDAARGRGRAPAQWLLRASHDRALENAAPGTPEKLFAALSAAPLLGTIEFEVPAKKRMKKRKGSRVTTLRSARTVCQEVRALRVTLRPPFRQGGRPPAVSLWALLAKETDPPAGEEPVSWVLLTSVPVETLAQAQRLIGYYLRRWDIEVFHRVLKTGCRAESLQLKNAGAVRNALILHAITAWRILYLTHLGRLCAEEPCHLVFAREEWQAACAVASRTSRPRDAPAVPSLGEIIRIIARFGGHLGRKGDGPPGAQVLWRGLARLRDFTTGRESLQPP